MVKKSKAKAKAKTSKAEKVTPTYLRRGASFTMSLQDVVRALKVIDKHKNLDKLVKAAKKIDTSVQIDASTVNFVKDFMVKHKMHADPVGKHIVNAHGAARAGGAAKKAGAGAGGGQDPFKCNFGTAG